MDDPVTVGFAMIFDVLRTVATVSTSKKRHPPPNMDVNPSTKYVYIQVFQSSKEKNNSHHQFTFLVVGYNSH